MTVEQQLADLVKTLTPEPPRDIAIDDIAARVRVAQTEAPSHRRWTGAAALGAAAVVVALALATTQGRSTRHVPATSVTPTQPAPTTPAVSPSSSVVAPIPGPARSGTVRLGPATLRLVGTWVARSMPGQTNPTWCLSPRSSHITANLSSCPLWFRQIVGIPRHGFSPDEDTATSQSSVSPATRCREAGGERVTVDYRILPFGARNADYRRWTQTCANGAHYDISQYVIITSPAYVLFSDRANNTVRSVMAQLVTSATLPKQNAPLPFSLLGTITSKQHDQHGYHVVLRQQTRVTHGGTNPAPFLDVPGGQPQPFLIPDRLVPDGGVSLNGLISVTTDGHHVTALTIVGG